MNEYKIRCIVGAFRLAHGDHKKTAQLLQKRWHMGIGYMDLASGEVKPPSATRHAGLAGLCQVIQAKEAGHRACCDDARAALPRLAEMTRGA